MRETYLAIVTLCVLISTVELHNHGMQEADEYAVIVDAGSSGSRVRVYKWKTQTDRNRLPSISEVFNHKVKPGISAYSNDLDGLNSSIGKLLEEAKANVPEKMQKETRIYMMATAGMRLLMEDKANSVIEKINSIFMDSTVNPFDYSPHNTRILSGEEEGVFAWIAVNYLNDYFENTDVNVKSAGILEQGGASLQIAFQPDGSILADKFPTKVAGKIYPLYVHSFLDFGQTRAQDWIKEHLERQNTIKQITVLENPCMLKNDTRYLTIRGNQVEFSGTGDPEYCNSLMDGFVQKADPVRCQPKPCSIGNVYQPSIPNDMDIFAMGGFWRVFNTFKNTIDENGRLMSMEQLRKAINSECNQTIAEFEQKYNQGYNYASQRCNTAMLIDTLLTKAFKIPVATRVIATDKVKGSEPVWTLGALIYENERKDWKCPSAHISSANALYFAPLSLLASLIFYVL